MTSRVSEVGIPATNPGGTEWMIDAHGCAPARLRSRTAVTALLDAIVDAMKLRVVSTVVHEFPGPGGLTAMYLLAESHLTIHTFPEHESATLNAYCCSPREPARWRELCAEHLGARDVRVAAHARGDRG